MRDVNTLIDSIKRKKCSDFLEAINHTDDYKTIWYEAVSKLIPIRHVKWLWDEYDPYTNPNLDSIAIISDNRSDDIEYTQNRTYYDYSLQRSFNYRELNSMGLYIKKFMSLDRIFQINKEHEFEDLDKLFIQLNNIKKENNGKILFTKERTIRPGSPKIGYSILRGRAGLATASIRCFGDQKSSSRS